MTRTTLYRAYRPQSLKDVVGQEHITAVLERQVKEGTLAHAYLFAGGRGLGKTSIARILAKELECDDADIFEIDAASNNSVEDIRTLNENIYTLPFNSKKKFYILDEAHMLSRGAWNAFLKTLEEPPAHAMFVLATTELSKVPETVQSRCQVFEFKKASRENIETLITHIAKQEKRVIGAGVAEVIALLAKNSYRDALSHFEKVLSAIDSKTISREEVETLTGAPSFSLVRDCADAVAHRNAEKALSCVHKVHAQGMDAEIYLSMLTDYVRSALLLQYAPALKGEIQAEVGEEEVGVMLALSKDKESGLTHDFLRLLLEANARIRYQSVPVVVIELAIIEHLSKVK